MSNSASAGRLIAAIAAVASRRSRPGVAAGRSLVSTSADRGSAMAPSARMACTLTPSGCRSSPASASIAGREAASFSSPRPLMAKPRVIEPPRTSQMRSAGSVSAFRTRCSAKASGHQSLDGLPSAASTAERSAATSPRRTSA